MKVWNSVNDEYGYHFITVKPEFLQVLRILNIPDTIPPYSSYDLAKKIKVTGRAISGIISSMNYYQLVKHDGYCGQYTLYRITPLGRENLVLCTGSETG